MRAHKRRCATLHRAVFTCSIHTPLFLLVLAGTTTTAATTTVTTTTTNAAPAQATPGTAQGGAIAGGSGLLAVVVAFIGVLSALMALLFYAPPYVSLNDVLLIGCFGLLPAAVCSWLSQRA